MASEVLIPSSAAEAVELYGDGAATTVIGGGTVVVPDLTYSRLQPERVLLLSHAGLDGVAVDGDTVTLGATTPVTCSLPSRRTSRRSPPAPGTWPTTRSAARPLSAGTSAATATSRAACSRSTPASRSAGKDGETTEPLEDFLGHRSERLVLDVSFERPAASAFVSLEYPHTHEYTVLAVTAVRSAGGETRLAATGLAGPGARLRSAEALASDPAAAAAAAPGDVTFADDALASAWYRGQTLPVLVRRALTQLEEPS